MIVAYLLTVLLIASGGMNFILLPLISYYYRKIGSPLLTIFVSYIVIWWGIDQLWVFSGAGVLPMTILVFAFCWSPFFEYLLGERFKKNMKLSLYSLGWSAFTYGIVKCFVDDPIRWV